MTRKEMENKIERLEKQVKELEKITTLMTDNMKEIANCLALIAKTIKEK